MIPFTYERATDVPAAVDFLRDHDGAKLIAGGTNLLDLMKLEVETPDHLLDINRIGLDRIEQADGAARAALGLSEGQTDELERNRALRSAPTRPAIEQYTGVLYDALDAGTLDAAARRWLALAADNGDGAAADTLGLMDYNGEGGAVDPASAYAEFVRAAGHGDPHGATNAGRLLISGRPGVSRDVQGGVTWFMQGAAHGDPDGEFLLGTSLLRGWGVAQDTHNAACWLNAAVAQDHIEARAALADLYLAGTGVPRDPQRGFALMTTAPAAAPCPRH